jgi:hypothetical protein
MIELRRRYSGKDVHHNIPPEYQQVEYLETQGDGAYIKTNVLYDSTQYDYEIECKYLITQRTVFAHIFGASEGGNYNSIIFAQSDTGNSYLAFFNKSTILSSYLLISSILYFIVPPHSMYFPRLRKKVDLLRNCSTF